MQIKRAISLIMTILGACISYASYGRDTTSSNEAARALAQQIVQEAEKYLGTRYRAGGKGPNSFDCSGFTSFVYKQFGYTLSHNSAKQATEGTEVEAGFSNGWNNMQTGDIVVFSGRRISKKPGHVGIYTGPGKNGSGFEFIHAARDGIRYSNIDEPYYAARFICVRRILPDFTDTLTPVQDSTFAQAIARDLKIIIHPDGKWELDKESGTGIDSLSRNILLLPDGNWCMTPEQPESAAAATNAHKPAPDISTSEIKAGQKPNNGKAQENNDSSKARFHTIKKGDTLYKIAKRNRTTINALCELNGIPETMTLQIGQKIRIR